MTKRQLVKWIEQNRSMALLNEEKQYQAARKALSEKRDEIVRIDEVTEVLYKLISKADDIVSDWKTGLDESGIVSTCSGYYGSMSYQIGSICDKDTIKRSLLKDFSGYTDLIDLDRKDQEIKRSINANYRNVISNVQNMSTAKAASQYLQELGFDLSDLIEADKHPVSTALSVKVDTRFLFIGGVDDERKEQGQDTGT